MLKQELKKEMNFHNLSEETTHNIYEIIEYNTGIKPMWVGRNRGERVYSLDGKLYKAKEFSVYGNECWVTLREYKGRTEPKFINNDEEKAYQEKYNYETFGSIDHFKW